MEGYRHAIFKFIDMSVLINSEKYSQGVLLVNNKEVYKDTNGKWIARSELTIAEYNALKQHLEMLEDPLS